MKITLMILFFTLLFAGLTFAQDKSAAGFNVGADLPTGDFGNSFKTGWGLEAIYLYGIQPDLDITGTVGYHRWSPKLSSDRIFSTVPILAGIHYSFGDAGGFSPYVMGKMGLYLIIKLVSMGLHPPETDFGFLVGTGVLIPAGNNFNVDINVSYNNIGTPGNATSYLGIRAGAVFDL